MTGWLPFALGSAFFAALTAILGKVGVSEVNSDFATFIRTIVILVVTILIVSMRGEWQRIDSVPMKSLVFLGFSGVATGLSWLCYYRALQLGPASKVAPVDKLSVAFVILLSVFLLKESLTWKAALGGVLVVAGSLVLALS